jgi:hypothetical protein
MCQRPQTEHRIRAAKKEDLIDIVRIVDAGFPDDPEVDYRFPHRNEYPEDYLHWTRREYENYIERPDKYVCQLAEVLIESEGVLSWKAAAVAVWDVAPMIEDKTPGMRCCCTQIDR